MGNCQLSHASCQMSTPIKPFLSNEVRGIISTIQQRKAPVNDLLIAHVLRNFSRSAFYPDSNIHCTAMLPLSFFSFLSKHALITRFPNIIAITNRLQAYQFVASPKQTVGKTPSQQTQQRFERHYTKSIRVTYHPNISLDSETTIL